MSSTKRKLADISGEYTDCSVVANDKIISSILNDKNKTESQKFQLLGYYYEKEMKDIDTANDYYLRSINKDDGQLDYELAECYGECSKNKDKIVECLETAKCKGHLWGITKLVVHYGIKNNFEKSTEYAKTLFKNCAKNISNICHVVTNLDSYRKFDFAENLLISAFSDGNPKIFCMVGHCIENIRCFKSAEKYYELGVKHGCIISILYLGKTYSKTNREKAIECYKKGLELKNADCAILLGNLYHNKDVNSDFMLAYKYYSFAIEHGRAEMNCICAYICHFKTKQYDKAKQHYDLAYPHMKRMVDFWNYASFYLNIEHDEKRGIEADIKAYLVMEQKDIMANIKKHNNILQLKIYNKLMELDGHENIKAQFRIIPHIAEFAKSMETAQNGICVVCNKMGLLICYNDIFMPRCVDCCIKNYVNKNMQIMHMSLPNLPPVLQLPPSISLPRA